MTRTRVAALLIATSIVLVGAACADRGSGRASDAPADVVSSTTSPSGSSIDPAPTLSDGPMAVGITVIHLTDPSRPLKARGDRPASTERSFDVVVRYPIAGAAGAGESVDATPLGPAPLVVFAQGFATSTATYATLLHEIAASGFVVAAPEFPMTSAAIAGIPEEIDLIDEPRDLSFVIGSMTAEDRSPLLASMVRSGPVALIGHSDGAQAALLCAYAPRYGDGRVGAVIALSGRLDAYGGTWFSTPSAPLLAIHGMADEINPLSRSRELVDADPFPAMVVAVTGASHLGVATDPRFVPDVARLIVDDLRWRLLAESGAREATLDDAKAPPFVLLASHD